MRTFCVNLFATRALVGFAEAGTETKTHSNSDCLVVEPQPACNSGRARSQSLLWGADAARSLALLKLYVKADMTTAWSAIIPDMSQNGLLRITW